MTKNLDQRKIADPEPHVECFEEFSGSKTIDDPARADQDESNLTASDERDMDSSENVAKSYRKDFSCNRLCVLWAALRGSGAGHIAGPFHWSRPVGGLLCRTR